jgi:hypothetical protein
MKNANIIDTQYLKQASMSNGTLLAIFADFLLAHALFFMFPPATPVMLSQRIPDPFGLGLASNPGEAMTLIPLTLALLAACIVRFSARITPVGLELEAMKRLALLRILVISLLSFSLGGVLIYSVSTADSLSTLQLASFGLLLGSILCTIAGLVRGQEALRPE